jgi:hypothetical protein
MHILPDHAHPLVRPAVSALDVFGANSAREAMILLGYWRRRQELTLADIDAVLSHYGDRVSDPRSADPDPTGSTYQRESDEPARLVPPCVEGRYLTGRQTSEGGPR